MCSIFVKVTYFLLRKTSKHFEVIVSDLNYFRQKLFLNKQYSIIIFSFSKSEQKWHIMTKNIRQTLNLLYFQAHQQTATQDMRRLHWNPSQHLHITPRPTQTMGTYTRACRISRDPSCKRPHTQISWTHLKTV